MRLLVTGGAGFIGSAFVRYILGGLTMRPSSRWTVSDRPGHDRRYALGSGKLALETGFVPETSFDRGLAATVQWYRDNSAWIGGARSGEYREFYRSNYGWRNAADTAATRPS